MVELGRFGAKVRLRPEVEFLVKKLATRMGYHPYTVRNVAVLYGLVDIVMSRRLPESDPEFEELLRKVEVIVGVGEEASGEVR